MKIYGMAILGPEVWLKYGMGQWMKQEPLYKRNNMTLLEDFIKVGDIIEHKGSKVSWTICSSRVSWFCGTSRAETVGNRVYTIKSINSGRTKNISTRLLSKNYNFTDISPGLRVLFLEN